MRGIRASPVAAVLKVLNQMRASLMAGRSVATGALGRAAGRAKRAAALGEEDAFWQRVGRIVDGEDSLAAGVSWAVPLMAITLRRSRL